VAEVHGRYACNWLRSGMAKSPNQAEFESLGAEVVARRLSASIWDAAKSREARIWLSRQERRIDHEQYNALMIAAIATTAVTIATVIALILSILR
jgi:hypothetical protein